MATQKSSDTGPDVTETTADADRIGRAVVEAVAERKDVPTTALEERLYHAVDPDALEEFVASVGGTDTAPVEVSFAYAGFDVTVTGDGTVTLAAT